MHLCYILMCRIINDTIIKTDAGRLIYKYVPLTLLQGFEKGYSRFACERELETEHNWNILMPTLMAVNVVSFLFSWYSTGGPGPTLLGDGFLYCILSATFLVPKCHQGSRRPPQPGVALPTSSRTSPSDLPGTRTQLSYIILQRPLDLWNRMLNHHQVEITVMQFTGHSLPVHQSISVPWEFFLLLPFHQPISAHTISSHNCH